jgi:hypothetical protein
MSRVLVGADAGCNPAKVTPASAEVAAAANALLQKQIVNRHRRPLTAKGMLLKAQQLSLGIGDKLGSFSQVGSLLGTADSSEHLAPAEVKAVGNASRGRGRNKGRTLKSDKARQLFKGIDAEHLAPARPK